MSGEIAAGVPPTTPTQGSSFVGPLLLCVAGIAVTSLALLSYHCIIVRCHGRRRSHESKQAVGVDPEILGMIPIVAYCAKQGVVDVLRSGRREECTVCLGELEDGEMVRSLPGCRHTYHAMCIDQWFRAHTSCPVCRSPVEKAVKEGQAQRASHTTPQQPGCVGTSRGGPVYSVNAEFGTHHVAIDIGDENRGETTSRKSVVMLMRSKSLYTKPTRTRSGGLSSKLIRSLSQISINGYCSNETIPRLLSIQNQGSLVI